MQWFFCWAFMWVSILAACRSRLVYWLYFNVNRPLLFMEYRPVWLLFNGNWILLFCKRKTALEARKVSLDVMKYLPESPLFLLFILFACYVLTSPPSAALHTLFSCLAVFSLSQSVLLSCVFFRNITIIFSIVILHAISLSCVSLTNFSSC